MEKERAVLIFSPHQEEGKGRVTLILRGIELGIHGAQKEMLILTVIGSGGGSHTVDLFVGSQGEANRFQRKFAVSGLARKQLPFILVQPEDARGRIKYEAEIPLPGHGLTLSIPVHWYRLIAFRF